MRSCRYLSACAVLLGVVLCAAGAAAGERTAEVQKQIDQATRYYEDGQYDLAIRTLQAAHERHPDPLLLFNIAQAQRKAGRLAESLASYRQYLAQDPQGPYRQKAEAYIAELERATAPPPPPPTPIRQPDLTLPRQAPPPPRPIYKRWWLWTVVGLVTAGAVTGIVVGTLPRGPDLPPDTPLDDVTF